MNVEETFLDSFKEIRKSRIREADKRDKVFLSVTTGSLVLSVSFLTLKGLDSVNSLAFLLWSWITLLSSIVFQLLSYVFVDLHFISSEKTLLVWKEGGMKIDEFPSEHNKWERITIFSNYLSYILTITGLILFVFFGWYNIGTMSRTEEKRKFANPISMPSATPTHTSPQVNPNPNQPNSSPSNNEPTN